MNTRPSSRRDLLALVFAALCVAAPATQAALTDIANVPLASSSTTVVKPNILFTLDDSGSMDRVYMPDEISGRSGTTGFKNHLCNSIYYNPAVTYVAPKNADGTNFADATFTNAKTNGFSSSSGTVNLDTSFTAHGSDTAQRGYYYVWSAPRCTRSSADVVQRTSGRPAAGASAFLRLAAEPGVRFKEPFPTRAVGKAGHLACVSDACVSEGGSAGEREPLRIGPESSK